MSLTTSTLGLAIPQVVLILRIVSITGDRIPSSRFTWGVLLVIVPGRGYGLMNPVHLALLRS
jgi:hypothetical protein